MRLFLDFDGTLAPVRPSTDAVRLSRRTRQALDRLVRHRRVRTAIVSGRRRADLIRLVSLGRVQYWGLYGWERRAGRSLPARARVIVSRVRARLTSRFAGLPGVRVEDKGFALSIHFRGAPRETVRQARARLRRALADYEDDLHLVAGTKTWTVLPREVPGKGAAVREAIERVRSPYLPIYVGDDATDEPAFAVLGRGITIRVGKPRRTNARYRLSSTYQVQRFIERLHGALS